MIKYKKSDGTHAWHGASLKASEGTASNNGLEAFDTHSVFNGNNTNLRRAWTGQKNGQVAAQHHVTMFNSGTLEDKKNHLHYLLKSRPDVSYHYVIADQGKSTPIEDHPVIKAITAAENAVIAATAAPAPDIIGRKNLPNSNKTAPNSWIFFKA